VEISDWRINITTGSIQGTRNNKYEKRDSNMKIYGNFSCQGGDRGL